MEAMGGKRKVSQIIRKILFLFKEDEAIRTDCTIQIEIVHKRPERFLLSPVLINL